MITYENETNTVCVKPKGELDHRLSETIRNSIDAEILKNIPAIAAEGRAVAEANSRLPIRVQSVSMRLLLRHAEYCERLAEVMAVKAVGEDAKAHELWDAFRRDFGKYEFELERWFDHGMTMMALHI